METHEFTVVTLDVNTRGLVVLIGIHVPESTSMEVSLTLGAEKAVKLKGKVIKIDPPEPVPGKETYRVALALEDPGPEEMRELSGYLLLQLSRERHRIQ